MTRIGELTVWPDNQDIDEWSSIVNMKLNSDVDDLVQANSIHLDSNSGTKASSNIKIN